MTFTMFILHKSLTFIKSQIWTIFSNFRWRSLETALKSPPTLINYYFINNKKMLYHTLGLCISFRQIMTHCHIFEESTNVHKANIKYHIRRCHMVRNPVSIWFIIWMLKCCNFWNRKIKPEKDVDIALRKIQSKQKIGINNINLDLNIY